jgi:hypothetical protein
LISNPLSNDTNGLSEIFPSIPNGTTFLFWNGSGYNYLDYDASLGINGDGSPWYDANLNEAHPPIVTPGEGFFVNPGGPMTNTFTGTVNGVNASTNSTALPGGYSMLGTELPVGGSITNAAVSFPFSNGTTFLVWTGSGYTYYDYDASLGINGDGSPWYDANLNEIVPPTVGVGQGIFINPGTPTNWVQNLQLN